MVEIDNSNNRSPVSQHNGTNSNFSGVFSNLNVDVDQNQVPNSRNNNENNNQTLDLEQVVADGPSLFENLNNQQLMGQNNQETHEEFPQWPASEILNLPMQDQIVQFKDKDLQIFHIVDRIPDEINSD